MAGGLVLWGFDLSILMNFYVVLLAKIKGSLSKVH
jgi:hypothetical protein